MKRSELQVGDHLFHARPGGWRFNSIDHYDAHVVVLHTAPHVLPPAWSRDRSPIETEKGAGVLVAFVNEKGEQGRAGVCQLANLRGPYEKTRAEVEERREADRRRNEEHRAARARFDRHRADGVARARAAGLTRATEANNLTATTNLGNARVSVPVEELHALLDRLEAAEATVTGLRAAMTADLPRTEA